jgi:hypothetical protein
MSIFVIVKNGSVKVCIKADLGESPTEDIQLFKCITVGFRY